MPNEAEIAINGIVLTEAQSMTIRVALEMLAIDVQDNLSSNNQPEKDMAAFYLARIKEIKHILFETLSRKVKINSRRPLSFPGGYHESDQDFVLNNIDACVAFLESQNE